MILSLPEKKKQKQKQEREREREREREKQKANYENKILKIYILFVGLYM
jgi:hypothetical protein